MKKSIRLLTKVTQVLTLIMLCLTFSCQQLGKEAITEEEAKAYIERELEIFNEGNLALVDELFAPDYVDHMGDISEDLVGIDAVKEWATNIRTMFPDLNITTEEIIVKDDKIVWRYTTTGTNTGTTSDIPPTGKKTRMEGVGILRVVNGKIIERLIYYNEATQLSQLGYTIIPPQPSEEK